MVLTVLEKMSLARLGRNLGRNLGYLLIRCFLPSDTYSPVGLILRSDFIQELLIFNNVYS